jgi:hypothetical protein
MEVPKLNVTLNGIPVTFAAKEMPGGAMRYRLTLGTKATFHLTEGGRGGWEEAHFHKGLYEHYVVMKGKIIVAIEDALADESRISLRPYHEGEAVTVKPNCVHNVFLCPFSIIAVTKWGEPIGNPAKQGKDWWEADSRFSNYTQRLTQEEMLNSHGKFIKLLGD